MVNLKNLYKTLWKKIKGSPQKLEIQYPQDQWEFMELKDGEFAESPVFMYTTSQDEQNLLVLVYQLSEYQKLTVLVESSPDHGITKIRCAELEFLKNQGKIGDEDSVVWSSIEEFNDFCNYSKDSLPNLTEIPQDANPLLTANSLLKNLLSLSDWAPVQKLDKAIEDYAGHLSWTGGTWNGNQSSRFTERSFFFFPKEIYYDDKSLIEARCITTREGVLLCLGIYIKDIVPSGELGEMYEKSIVIFDSLPTWKLHLVATGGKEFECAEWIKENFGKYEVKAFDEFRLFLDSHEIGYELEDNMTRAIPSSRICLMDRKDKGCEGSYTSYEWNVTVQFYNKNLFDVAIKEISKTGGYWHDNPNYPYSDISGSVILLNPKDVTALCLALGFVYDNEPEGLANELGERIKQQCQSQTGVRTLLDKLHIPYTLKNP